MVSAKASGLAALMAVAILVAGCTSSTKWASPHSVGSTTTPRGESGAPGSPTGEIRRFDNSAQAYLYFKQIFDGGNVSPGGEPVGSSSTSG